MCKVIFALLAAGSVWTVASGAPTRDEGTATPPPARSGPIRVLLVTGGHGFEHGPFLEVFKSLPDVEFKEVQQPEALRYFAPEKADTYDVMVWYDFVQKIGEQDKQNLVELLRSGKGLVALHHCLADYQAWPEALQIMGGRYWLQEHDGKPGSTFKEGVDLHVKVVDGQHPVTRSMKDFDIHDEAYGNLEMVPDVTPLLAVDHPQSNKVVAWAHTYGRSPVVAIQLGHGPEAYANPAFRQLVGQAIRWAAGAPSDSAGSRGKKERVWRLGTQAYTFRLYTFFEAVDKAKALGLKYIEAYPGQAFSPDQKDVKWDHNTSAEIRAKAKAKLKEAGVKLVCYGVCGITKDEKETRKIFEFARDMGIETITAEPEPAAMDLLDKLTEEYKINVAIHNHPKSPLTRYWNPQTVLDTIKGHSKRIGACADTGHWVRSGLDPIECLQKLEGHIISLHFKDLNEKDPKAHDVVWGTGVGNVKGMLEELQRQGFSGVFSVEYEHNWETSMPEIAQSLEYFRRTAKELGHKVE